MTTTEERCQARLDAGTCTNQRVAKGPLCNEHGCGICGHVMLADTEDWPLHWCDDCLGEVTFLSVVDFAERELTQLEEAGSTAATHAVWKLLQDIKSGRFR